MKEERLESLLEGVEDADEVLIMAHNDPDPDAIASAVALRQLLEVMKGVKAHIGYAGIIGRAENKALVRYLGNPLRRLDEMALSPSVPVALVDTQPGAGNNACPRDANVAIVLDHHPMQEATLRAAFVDVRSDVGATSTMLTEYLRAAGIVPALAVSTALFYGIKTDTMGLSRGAGPDDVAAYLYLQSRIDVRALVEIERAQVSEAYFRGLVGAVQSARIYGEVVVSYLGMMTRSDMAAEMADLMLRLDGVRWVICMGVFDDEMILSVRTQASGGAEQLIQRVVGDLGSAGGHGAMAGGQIPLRGEDPDLLARRLTQRTLALLDAASERPGRSLI